MPKVNRLIEQFVPKHYELDLTLEREKRIFSGLVTVTGTTTETGTISLHAKDLEINTVNLNGHKASYKEGENDEIVIVGDIQPNFNYAVQLAFSGRITDAMHGVYPCYYTVDGEKKELLGTQFESHHAREVFPCIDEPEAKSTYDVSLTTEKNVQVLGNMPIKTQREETDGLVTTFETTPRMSSYLLAFVVGDLHKKSAKTNNGVDVNVWATSAQSPESLNFALDIAVRSIDFYNEFFETPYPLPKSDHVALPDFSAGAMENWGLITYREIALLADPKTTSISSKQYIATVVAHELAHQWFGNLVTMKWWNNLWLNESFADLMEYLTVDALEPSWKMWTEFSEMEGLMAFRRDSLDGVQSVQMDVNHPDDISTLFDGAIVYAKGGRLLRMLQQYVGVDAFRAGLKQYFQDHAYSNTEADDLWKALSEASGKNISEFMTPWLTEPGYPVLHVTREGSELKLKQEQFFVGPHVDKNRLWPIPLNANIDGAPEVMTEETLTIPFHEGVRFNAGDTAHFITHYDNELLADILRDVTDGTLTELDRLQLIDEQTLLARAEILPNSSLIPLIREFADETSEPVWNLLAAAIGELQKFVETNKEAENRLRALAGNLAEKEYERLGWHEKEDESEADTKLRATILGEMLYSERPTVIDEALKLYESKKLEELEPEIRALILSAAVRYSKEPVVDTLLNVYKTTSNGELQHDIMAGITSSRDPEVLKKLLALTKDKSVVRPQDATGWYVNILRNRYGRDMAWQWLQDNWQWVLDTFASEKSYDYFPRYAGAILRTKQQLAEYKKFFEPMLDQPALTRAIQIGIGEIQGRVTLLDNQSESVQTALLQY